MLHFFAKGVVSSATRPYEGQLGCKLYNTSSSCIAAIYTYNCTVVDEAAGHAVVVAGAPAAAFVE